MDDFDNLGITALKAIAKAEGLKNYSSYRSANKNELAQKIRQNRRQASTVQKLSVIQQLPLELHDQIGQHLSDSDKINLYLANSQMYLTLDDWYTLDELNALNQELGERTSITDKFRIRKLTLYPNQSLPNEFQSIRGLQIRMINLEYFIKLLIRLIISEINVRSVTVNGKVYPAHEGNDVTISRPRRVPINSINYQYTLNVKSKRIGHQSDFLVEMAYEDEDEFKFGTPEEIKVANDVMYKLFKNPSQFRTSEMWNLRNSHPSNQDWDERGSDQYHGIPIQLPLETNVTLPVGSTLDDVVQAVLKLKSHKFDIWYETLPGIDVTQKENVLDIDLIFDYGS